MHIEIFVIYGDNNSDILCAYTHEEDAKEHCAMSGNKETYLLVRLYGHKHGK